MSIFFPYSSTQVITYLESIFSISLSSLSSYETVIITLFANLYFFCIWFFIIFFSLKGLNWVYERIF